VFPSRLHFPVPLGSTVVTRFLATTGTLTPAPLVLAQNRSPWFTHLNCWIFRLQPPHALLSADIASGRAGLANDSLWGLSSVLRISLTICRLISRIRPNRVCVAAFEEHDFSTDYPFTFSCSPRGIAGSQLLSVTDGKLRQRGTFTLLFKCAPKRTYAAPSGAWSVMAGGSTKMALLTEFSQSCPSPCGQFLGAALAKLWLGESLRRGRAARRL